MDWQDRMKYIFVIVVLIVVCLIISSFKVSLSLEGGKTIEDSLLIAANSEIEIKVSIHKGESFSPFYYYWDDPDNRVDLQKSWFVAYGTTKIPGEKGLHKLTIIVSSLFTQKYEYFYKVAN